SFQVSHGEVVGVIGRNGAGKSTLLKVLSRITEPTRGRAVIDGRVGSLLEVGTGFHPELSGRENLFLNGAILGMTRREIQRKYDEIVAFAEIERFIDTPVKRYSSGMYMRLAFSVAAHLEPEILVIDEVLAVGDVSFQRKCLDKMESVGRQGRTVLFVSHNLPAITRLCQRAILLDDGKLVQDGAAGDVVRGYLKSMTECSESRQWDGDGAPGSSEVKLVSVSLLRDDKPVSVVSVKDELELELRYRVLKAGSRFRCSVNLATQGICAFSTLERTEGVRPAEGLYVSRVRIPANFLAEGEYLVNVAIISSRGVKVRHALAKEALAFHVADPIDGTTARGDYAERLSGVVNPVLDWRSWKTDDELSRELPCCA
ncbi:MAG: ABC transporter ATP-binding protein, partial [Planctomycetes bacterium]|nr:ABC transporter ATP-binding protein [Planctomycetota bacterium]